MLRIILLASVICLPVRAFTQSCSMPQPLIQEQKGLINGDWTGYYVLDGKRTEFTVQIRCSESIQCEISNPPVTEEILKETYRFCGSGAFHFRKETAHEFYEFDGVPENGEMKGTLATDADGKKVFGKFYLKRSELKDSQE